MKQLSTWAAGVDLLPHDPLGRWKRLQRDTPREQRRAFSPDDMRAIVQASDDLDALRGSYSSSVIWKTLLITGNRPKAVFGARVCDLKEDRVELPAGTGKKHNGRATIPPEFAAELGRYVAARGRLKHDDPLLVSPQGSALDSRNIQETFKRACILAAVRTVWPGNDPATTETTPLAVALAIHKGKPDGFDGAPPTDDTKRAERERQFNATKALMERLAPTVTRWLEGRCLYSLRARATIS